MKAKFNFLEAESILSVVVVLIIMAVGVFAFFTVMQSIPSEQTTGEVRKENISQTLSNITGLSNTVFSLLPIVFIVAIAGIIMSVVGGFACGGRDDDDEKPIKLSTRLDKTKEKLPEYKPTDLTYKGDEVSMEKETEESLKKKLSNREITADEYNSRMMKLWFQKK